MLRRRISRRQLLGAGAALAAAAGLGFTCTPPPPWPPVPQRGRASGPRNLAWVWQFSADGPPEQIASVLAQYNLGILLKTHDGTDWMSRYDASLYAVHDADQVGVLASYYETYGVPFHAWCVVKGLEPQREAEMCAQVIAAGARSMTVDLEPHSGFWQGTPQAAVAFGRELRKRQPNPALYVSLDPRPWVMSRVPLAEFASFSQGFAPQVYWETFNSSDNVQRFQSSGFPPGKDGVTPEFLLNVSRSLLGRYGRPIQPAGQGASRNTTAWTHFLSAARKQGISVVSAWRYGVTGGDVWRLLRDWPGQPGPTPTPTAGLSKGGNAIVANTGTCLNVREAASTTARILACLPDGTIVQVRDGPVAFEGYRWWFIGTEVISGWAAEAGPDGVPWLVPWP
jgi:hypothetical protein